MLLKGVAFISICTSVRLIKTITAPPLITAREPGLFSLSVHLSYLSFRSRIGGLRQVDSCVVHELNSGNPVSVLLSSIDPSIIIYSTTQHAIFSSS